MSTARILRACGVSSHNAGVEKSTFTPLYSAFRAKLIAMRKAAGLTQRELAARLGRERSFVGRIELGERRLDAVELFWVCKACSVEPENVFAELARTFSKMELRSAKHGNRRTIK